jgi:hypothetical protein
MSEKWVVLAEENGAPQIIGIVDTKAAADEIASTLAARRGVHADVMTPQEVVKKFPDLAAMLPSD